MSALSLSSTETSRGPQGPAWASAFAVRSCYWLRSGWHLLILAFLMGANPALAQDASPETPADDSSADHELDDLFGEDDLFGDTEADSETVAPSTAGSAATENDDIDAVADRGAEQAPPEPAEGRQDPSKAIEEILIRGQAARGIEADAAVSVTQFDASDLEALGVQDVSDVAQFTPNLEIRTAGATVPTFYIRGVGLNDFTANASGAIAIFQDDVQMDLPAIQLAQLFDIEELEILRGPQGSGPNRNASGGSIRIYSRKPTGEYAGSLRASYGRFNEQDYEGALELPLLADVLATRVAFRLSKRDPIVENRCGNAPPIGLDRVSNPNRRVQPGICSETQNRINIPNPNRPPRNFRISALPTGLAEDLNDRNNWAARAQLRFTPTDLDMEWLLNVHGGRLEQLAQGGQAIGTVGFAGGTTGFFGGRTLSDYRAPEIAEQEEDIFQKLGGVGNDPVIRDKAQLELGRKLARKLDRKPFEGDFNRDGQETQTTAGGFLRGDFEFGFGQFTSITAAEYYERNRNGDSDYTSDNLFEFLIDDEAWQVSQEFMLSGELDDFPVQWNAGLSYLMGELNYDQRTIPSPVITDVSQVYEQRTWSVNPYLDMAWDFADDFTLEGGLRYNYEHKHLEIQLNRQGARICEDIFDPVSGRTAFARDCDNDQIWDGVTGYVGVSYNITEDASFYGKFSHGWKAGQFSAGGASGNTFTVADPEVVDAFEVGLKGSWFDGRFTAQASLFHYNYENYQVFLAANNANSPPQRIVTNADDAEIYGGEFETVFEFVDGFTYTSRFGWIESEFLDFTQEVFRSIFQGPQLPPIILPITIEWTGNRLPNTPRFKWSGSFEYVWELGQWGQLLPRWDYVWTDDVSFDASDGRGAPNINNQIFMPNHAIGQQAHWLHNVRLVYRDPSGAIEVAGWVRNVTNEVYKTLAFDASVGAGLVGNLLGDPRTYGVTLSLKW